MRKIGIIFILLLIFSNKWVLAQDSENLFVTKFFNFTKAEESDSIYFTVDKMPEVVGGIEAIMQKIVYPSKAKEKGTTGVVVVSALINEQGNVTETEVLKSVGDGCDEAAVNAIKQTKFTAGEQNGKKVKVRVNIPVSFKLNGNDKVKTEAVKDKDDPSIYVTVEKMPEIVGGVGAIVEKLVYPKEAKDKGIEGRVVISMVINENGNVTNIEVLKSLGYGCDEAAIQAVKSVKFVPGEHNGVKKKVKVVLPIQFKL